MLIGQDMTLKEYLRMHDMNVKEFAQKTAYSRNHLSSVIHGHLQPGRKLLMLIERATGGEVRPENAFSDVEPKG